MIDLFRAGQSQQERSNLSPPERPITNAPLNVDSHGEMPRMLPGACAINPVLMTDVGTGLNRWSCFPGHILHAASDDGTHDLRLNHGQT